MLLDRGWEEREEGREESWRRGGGVMEERQRDVEGESEQSQNRVICELAFRLEL